MTELITENLFLDNASHKVTVSQAVALGSGENSLSLVVNVVTATGATIDIDVTVETSDDLENWRAADASLAANITEAPSTTLVPQYFPVQVLGKYVRVRYENAGSVSVILSSHLQLFAA